MKKNGYYICLGWVGKDICEYRPLESLDIARDVALVYLKHAHEYLWRLSVTTSHGVTVNTYIE